MAGIGDLYDDFKALCKQWFYEKSEVDTALNGKQSTLVSGTNIKTVNNQSLLGSGDISIQSGGTGVDISTSWGDPTSDSKVPSEKLTKDSLDGKANATHSHGGIASDGKWEGTGRRGVLYVTATRDIISDPYVRSNIVSDNQTFTNITPTINFQSGINDAIDTALGNKQDTLVSGTNIKTVNNQSLLGTGNISISGGASNIFDLDPTSQYGDTVVEESVDKDGSGLGYANDLLIYNTLQHKFYYDKNGNADNDSDNELATIGDIGGGGGLTFDDIYPIGSIYMSVNSTDPSILFGGTWQQLTNTFLYASTTADTNSTTATGGEATHSLTNSEMPRHTHTQNGHSHSPSGDYDYFIATPTGGGAVSRNSNAGTTGTKVQNLLQSASGVARTNTNSVTATNKYTGGSGTSESASNGSAHNNMPPYMKVYMWKRTA